MRELDFLREAMNTWQAAVAAFDRSEEASSERVAAAAQTLALISLAEEGVPVSRLVAHCKGVFACSTDS